MFSSDLDSCCQHIEDNSQKQAIFLVTSDSLANSIQRHFRETQDFIHLLYVLTGSGTKYVDVLNSYGSQGILVKIVDVCESLPIRILHDISRYYFSKGVHQEKDGTAAAARDALAYFNFAKRTGTWTNQLTGFVNQDYYLNEIENHINHAKDAMTRGQCSDGGKMTRRHQQIFSNDEDSDLLLRIFIIGLSTASAQLDSDIGRLIQCPDNDEFIRIVSQDWIRSTPILVVSSEPVPIQVTRTLEAGTPLLFLGRITTCKSSQRCSIARREQCLYSMDQLMTELYHKLGQHYQNCAVRESFEARDQRKAKGFLEKSKLMLRTARVRDAKCH